MVGSASVYFDIKVAFPLVLMIRGAQERNMSKSGVQKLLLTQSQVLGIRQLELSKHLKLHVLITKRFTLKETKSLSSQWSTLLQEITTKVNRIRDDLAPMQLLSNHHLIYSFTCTKPENEMLIL